MRNRTIAQSYVMLAAGAILGFIRPGTAQELPPYPDWSGQWRIHTDFKLLLAVNGTQPSQADLPSRHR